METAITARLYFVLFSGAANSNNKLSPILPLQFPVPPFAGLLSLAKTPGPATELPFPSFRSPAFDCPTPCHLLVPRFLRVSSVSSPVRSPNDLDSRVRVVCRDTPSPSCTLRPTPPLLTSHPPSQDILQNSCVLQRGREHSSEDEGPRRWKASGEVPSIRRASIFRSFDFAWSTKPAMSLLSRKNTIREAKCSQGRGRWKRDAKIRAT